MVDALGWRKFCAVMGPSTNTIVQPEASEYMTGSVIEVDGGHLVSPL
jgi:hypothetical protein